MNRMIPSAALILTLAAPAAAELPTYYGFQVGVGNAPPLERLELEQHPRIARVEGSDVFAVDDETCEPDVFRFGLSWFVFTGEHWYRSTSLAGPFRAIDVRYVPRPVLQLPVHRWKRHPLAERGGRHPRRDRVSAVSVSTVGTPTIEPGSIEVRGPRHERGRPHRRAR
jgi:hypothetical protein